MTSSRVGVGLRRGFGNGLLIGGAKGLPYREDVEVLEDFDDLVVAEFEQPVVGLVVTAARFSGMVPSATTETRSSWAVISR